MDVLPTANHFQVLFELLQGSLVCTTHLHIAMTFAQACELIEGDSFGFHLLGGSTALEKLIAIPPPSALPLSLRIHFQRIEYHGQGAGSTEGWVALRREVSHKREISFAYGACRAQHEKGGCLDKEAHR